MDANPSHRLPVLAIGLTLLMATLAMPLTFTPAQPVDAAVIPPAAKFGNSGPNVWHEYGTGYVGMETTIGVNWVSGNGKDALLQAMGATLCLRWDDNVPIGLAPTMQVFDCTSPLVAPTEPTPAGNRDPILYTDFDGGRTFAGGLRITPDPAALGQPTDPYVGLACATAGAAFSAVVWPQTCMTGCSVLAFTDDPGVGLQDTNQTPIWQQAANPCSLPAWDHETVTVGPWAHPTPASATFDRAVYYCSQYGIMDCWVSYDGGITFVPPSSHGFGLFPAGGADPTGGSACGGLHGHARITRGYMIADNATNDGPHRGHVYLPNKDCNGKSAFVFSTDNAESWNLVTRPPATWPADPKSKNSLCQNPPVVDIAPGHFDPGIAPSLDHGWVYFAQGEADGPGAGSYAGAYVGMTKTNGVTWEDMGIGNGACPGTKWFNVGDLAGVEQATFTKVIAGDDDRAAVAFLGSTSPNDYDSCGGGASAHIWHLYIAITYDAGKTWRVDQATKDPVQRGGIWPYGGGAVCRNLLDFNDVVTDKYGRILASYTDGCDGPCAGPTGTVGSSTGTEGKVARQTAGRGLLAKYDIADPAPKPLPKTESGPSAAGPDELAPAPDGATDTGDKDFDGIYDHKDNCPSTQNGDQQDSDLDSFGDACDADDDADGIPDGADNCDVVANPTQSDADADGAGDVCDPDADEDSVLNAVDNCWQAANGDQADMDADLEGDVCDADRDGDGVPNASDAFPDDRTKWAGAIDANAAKPIRGPDGRVNRVGLGNEASGGGGAVLWIGALVVGGGLLALMLLMMRRKA